MWLGGVLLAAIGCASEGFEYGSPTAALSASNALPARPAPNTGAGAGPSTAPTPSPPATASSRAVVTSSGDLTGAPGGATTSTGSGTSLPQSEPTSSGDSSDSSDAESETEFHSPEREPRADGGAEVTDAGAGRDAAAHTHDDEPVESSAELACERDSDCVACAYPPTTGLLDVCACRGCPTHAANAQACRERSENAKRCLSRWACPAESCGGRQRSARCVQQRCELVE